MLPDLEKAVFFVCFPSCEMDPENCLVQLPIVKCTIPPLLSKLLLIFLLCWECVIYAMVAHSVELLWDMTESAWLLQRYVSVYLVPCWHPHCFRIRLTFNNSRSFHVSVYLRLM